jgi:lipopolysaccharide transport system ATP-binding protein
MSIPSESAVRVRGLGKAYNISHLEKTQDLAAVDTKTSRWPWLRRATGKKLCRETFWALQDINFDVPRGEIFGIIGCNGAGKSTLLKILSRITEPTKGFAEIQGRVGSLLEVGTGFHPELTGRENIYLNGTLLGMRRRQIDRIFDEIVDFAEVERFIDTPVKRYSSGMYVRLAFGVAANLEPDVLIIDEVLAVGDIQFQKKCLGKMKDVTGQGRTVLFVSHNLTTVNSLCSQCLLLEEGQVKLIGPTERVTESYFAASNDETGTQLDFASDPPGDDQARLLSARLVNQSGEILSYVRIDEEFGVEMTYEVSDVAKPIVPNLHFFHAGQCAFVTSPDSMEVRGSGVHRATAWIPARFLNEGSYTVNLAATTIVPQCVHFHVMDRFSFQVIEDIHDSARHGYVHSVPGAVRPRLAWSVQNEQS